MRRFLNGISMLGMMATLTTGSANAQQPAGDTHSSWYFDLHPTLTQPEFKEFTAQLGEVLRSRQLGDTNTVPKGRVMFSAQFANNSIDDSTPAWIDATSRPSANDHLGRFMSFPRLGARFGVSDHADVGISGGLAPSSDYGVIGVDTKVALVKQGPSRPVSVSIRPSVSIMIAPSQLWAGTAGIDLSVSRAFGPISPYAGVAATTTGAMVRSDKVGLDDASASRSLGYAGISCRWRTLVVSGELEQGTRTRYAFGVGTSF